MFKGLGLLSKKFSEMPLWVQVITYFVLLGLYVYLFLCPRFVNGQMVVRTGHGGFIPYRGVDLQVSVEGRVLKFKTNESGYWSIPVISRLPEGIRLQVFHEDENEWHEVKLSSSDVWKKDDFRIEIMDKPPWVDIERVAKSGPAFDKLKHISFFDKLTNQANAAELVIPQEAISKAADKVSKEEIKQDIFEIIAKVTRSNQEISVDYPFSGKNGLSYVKRIKVIESIERKLSIKIPDEHWREIATAGQLVDYAYNRKILEAYNPDVYGLDKSASWPEINQMAPPDQRPVFEK